MGREFDALMINGTWSLCPRPLDKHIVRNKWVYKVKKRPDDSIEHFKARLVAKGYDQRSGWTTMKLSPPWLSQLPFVLFCNCSSFSLARLTIRCVECISPWVSRGRSFHGTTERVCWWHQTGLCLQTTQVFLWSQTSPRAWFRRLSQQLLELGFQESINDYSLFVLHTAKIKIFVLIYVDDILVTGSDDSAISTLAHSSFVKHFSCQGSWFFVLFFRCGGW